MTPERATTTHPASAAIPEDGDLVDRDTFRSLVGSFAAGVTLITSGVEGEFHAMTASAFTSLSLDPPMVLVCIDKRAETAGFIARHGAFGVNILAVGQVDLSNACAQKGTPESSLQGVEYRVGRLGLPLIDGCLAALECRTVQTYDGGDHFIVTGEVAGGIAAKGEPLLYFQGAYGQFNT